MNDPRAKKYFAKMPHVDQDPTHALWWDYSSFPLNIHGRISLFTSLGFGFAGDKLEKDNGL